MKPQDQKSITFEQLIIGAKNEEIGFKTLLQAMIDIDLFIACDEKFLSANKAMLPLCVEINNQKHVCVFSNKDWADQYLSRETAIVKLQAKEVLKLVPENYGLIINPNHDASVKFNPPGVRNIVKDFC